MDLKPCGKIDIGVKLKAVSAEALNLIPRGHAEFALRRNDTSLIAHSFTWLAHANIIAVNGSTRPTKYVTAPATVMAPVCHGERLLTALAFGGLLVRSPYFGVMQGRRG